MKLVMLRPSYNPEISGGTHLAMDLVSDLIKSGIEVEVVTPISKRYIEKVNELLDGCKVHRITTKYEKKNLISRLLRYFDVSFKMYRKASNIDCDIYMTHSMPPLLGPLGARLGRKRKKPVVYWEQDIVSNSLISTGLFGKPGFKQKLMFNIALKLEKITEKKSSKIITISEHFKNIHIKRGVTNNKVDVVYNWIDIEQVYPVKRNDNPLFDKLGIPKDKFIVSYCGNLGVPQNVEILVDAAEMLKDYEDIFFVIIGGGSREEYIGNYVKEKKLSNIGLYPLQPLNCSHYVYSIGDVGTIVGKSGTSHNGFPSKTWSIMAAGQAVIASFDLDSELCSFVEQGNCGLTIKPNSSNEMKDAVLYLFNNKNLTKEMSLNARKYVLSKFGRTNSTEKIIEIIKKTYNDFIV